MDRRIFFKTVQYLTVEFQNICQLSFLLLQILLAHKLFRQSFLTFFFQYEYMYV